jgi:UDP-3-O-[3-hydroxymyristoyl] glucosamine N-acyltransferase LpxD
MNSTLLFKPRDCFRTLKDFLDYLQKENFTFKVSENSFLEKNWQEIEAPLSSSFEIPSKQNFCYHLKNGEVSPSWGLVFRDLKKSTSLSSHELGVDYPEAALDLLLRKLAHKEWTGTPQEIQKLSQNYSHVKAETNVVIGPDCEIAEGVVLEAGVRIGARVKIGAGTRIGCGSRIADDTIIGNNCYFRGPVSLGGQGFGFIKYPQTSFPRHRIHVGRVVVGDGVRLGSFVGIDRGVLEDTVIGDFSATDNVVQIGHNCRLGKHNILCGLVGLAGSTIMGDFVTLGGLVVSKGHLTVGNQVQVGGFSAIGSDVEAGSQLRGVPARPIRRDLKIMAIQDKLPELYAVMKEALKGQKVDL